jgi:hypothetical protein
MAYQTTVTATQAVALAGLRADDNPVEIDTYACEDTSIGFGIIVQRGTADDEAKIGGNDIVGVTVRIRKELESDGSTVQYNQYEAMDVAVAGRFWCTIDGGGNAGDRLYYNATTGVLGAGTASAGEAYLPVDCILMTDTADGALGKCRFAGLLTTTTTET